MEQIYKREYKPNFSPEIWIAIYKRLQELKRMTKIPLIHKKICVEVIENHHTTAELHRLAEVDKNFQWLKSRRGNPMSVSQIRNILFDYFPEFRREHRKRKPQKHDDVRKEETRIKREINQGVCQRHERQR